MELNINYDLFHKIAESNKGFSLKRGTKHFLIWPVLATGAAVLVKNDASHIVNLYAFYSAMYTLTFGSYILTFKKDLQEYANDDLKKLSQCINALELHTTNNLIKNAKRYRTEYSINTDSKIPKIEQKKYFLLQNFQNCKTENTSLVQKHILGSRNYRLSIETPKKLIKSKKNQD